MNYLFITPLGSRSEGQKEKAGKGDEPGQEYVF